MSKAVDFIKNRNLMMHAWLLRAGKSVSELQFARVFSPDAPPIGWHLWHMARFADRLQAKLKAVSNGNPGQEVWHSQNLISIWKLKENSLGVFDSGMGQSHASAQAIVQSVGQNALIEYAQASFEACNRAISGLTEDDFEKVYFGILDYQYDPETGEVWATKPRESSVAQDLVFHASHASRHLGMMEALKGLLGSPGTLSV